MRATPPLVVVIPGLIWPRQTLADLTHDLPTPSLSRLIGLGQRRRAISANATACMLNAFGGTADSPAPGFAALRRLTWNKTGDATNLICLDPVSLIFVERQLMLGDPGEINLTPAEAEQLAASLAPSFASFGELHVDQPGQWSLRLMESARLLASPPLPELIGRRADLALTALDRPWRQALNEAQMILHTHPVNRQREAAGQALINSLWPWGGGVLPAPCAQAPKLVLAAAAEWHGMARHHGGEGRALPARWTEAATTPSLALLDGLRFAARSGNALAWRDELLRLERDWFTPLLMALRRGELGGIRLELPNDTGNKGGAGWRIDVGGLARFAFWRASSPLSCLAPEPPLAS